MYLMYIYMKQILQINIEWLIYIGLWQVNYYNIVKTFNFLLGR